MLCIYCIYKYDIYTDCPYMTEQIKRQMSPKTRGIHLLQLIKTKILLAHYNNPPTFPVVNGV